MKYEINPMTNNDYETFTLNIQHYFKASKTTIHKARNEIKTLSFLNKELVIKSFKKPNIINRIAYTFFRSSKAKKSYYNSLRLENFAPQPISYIEFYEQGLLAQSYFIASNYAYDFTIREALLENDFEDREQIFRAFARFTLALHNENIFHKDYSPGNILIKKEKNEYIFKVVDVNRMDFFVLNEKKRAQSFSKLWADNATLSLIADEYIKHYNCSENFTQNIIYYSSKNKKIKNFKKRLKGKAVND